MDEQTFYDFIGRSAGTAIVLGEGVKVKALVLEVQGEDVALDLMGEFREATTFVVIALRNVQAPSGFTTVELQGRKADQNECELTCVI